MNHELGRLGVLLGDLAGDGVGLSIAPIFELRRTIGAVDDPATHSPVVAAWEIRFDTSSGSRSYRGASIAEAVEEAFGNQSSWR